jgi:hypothetical protein
MMTGDVLRNPRATSDGQRCSTYNRLIGNRFLENRDVRRSNRFLRLHNKPANLPPYQREN